MDTGIDQILARKAERQQRDKAAAVRREENGERQPVIIEKSITGLYTCRYEKGVVPEPLRGMFTNIQSIYTVAKQRDIPTRIA